MTLSACASGDAPPVGPSCPSVGVPRVFPWGLKPLFKPFLAVSAPTSFFGTDDHQIFLVPI